MASTSNEINPENVDQVANDEYYDQDTFVSFKCARLFDRLLSKNIIRERGICLDELEARWAQFHGGLIATGWICFAEEPIKANLTLVREFYANAAETDFANDLVVTVRGKQVRFDPEIINAYYNLPNADNEVFRARASEMREQWFVQHLHDGTQPKWITMRKGIESTEFTVEAKAWLSIICARVMPSKNESDVTIERARLICALIEGMQVNVGQLIVQEMQEVVLERSKSLFFPSLITFLCYRAEVEKKDDDREKGPDKLIHPLKKRGAGNAQKKRKIDVDAPSFGQFSESTSAAAGEFAGMGPLQVGPQSLKHISHQVYGMETQIRQLVAGLPSGPAGEGTSAQPVEDPNAPRVPTLSSVIQEQNNLKERIGKLERGQKKLREHERKKSKFLTKIMGTLRQLCGAQKDDEDDDDEFVLSGPSSSSSSS